jgi:4-hydroxybenzoate polyprenyltransferase
MNTVALKNKLPDYLALIRFDKPIGTYLLLWPTLWALWIASEGIPPLHLLLIFCLGTFLTRSAGCVMNDFADRNFDGQVKRTANRPMATGRVSVKEAMALFAGLMLTAFMLVLLTNTFTILLSFAAVGLATIYPFMKRYTHLPQLVLGLAFSWGIPMAFSATLNELPLQLWLIYVAAFLWTIVYDTQYAMVDRDDDIKLGLKSTAILFAEDDCRIIGILQVCVMVLLALIGMEFSLGIPYYLGLAVAAGLFVYQQKLIAGRDRNACFKAFLNNNYVGMAIFVGLASHYGLQALLN